DVPQIKHPLPLFDDYLKRGYYPFAIGSDFDLRLEQIVNQTLESDIPIYATMNVATGRKLKQLMAIVAESVPFKSNNSTMADIVNNSRNKFSDYFLYIEEAGMSAHLRSETKGIRSVRKVDKIYLNKTNLVYNLIRNNQNVGNVRETFFFNQLRVKHS